MKGDWHLCGLENRTCTHALLTSSLLSPTYIMDKDFHTQYPYVLEIDCKVSGYDPGQLVVLFIQCSMMFGGITEHSSHQSHKM